MSIVHLDSVITEILQRMLDAGCAFADARVYDEDATESLTLRDGNLEGNAAGCERGLGVRVLCDGAWGFAATADLSAVAACFDQALANSRAAAMLPGPSRALAPQLPARGSYHSPVARDPFEVPLREKLALLQTLDAALRAEHVQHRIVSATFQRRILRYWNAEGTTFQRTQINTFGSMQVSATDASGNALWRSLSLSGNGRGTRGFEWLCDSGDFCGQTERLKEELAALLAAEPLPPGARDLILLPAQGRLQVHETIGHALELDRILGYELSYAGGSHVRPEAIGNLRYGSEKLNCVVGQAENAAGTVGYDDEGTPQYAYPLISRGLLVNVISSRLHLQEANAAAGREVVTASGAAARACAFYRTPIDRMTNVDILPGDDGTLEDIIADTEDGVIMDSPVSWSIGSNREHFHFGCQIAWEVKDGARTRVYQKPSYHGHTLEFWHALDRVGDDRSWRMTETANCAKGEPGQMMEVGHGTPVMRFRGVETGER